MDKVTNLLVQHRLWSCSRQKAGQVLATAPWGVQSVAQGEQLGLDQPRQLILIINGEFVNTHGKKTDYLYGRGLLRCVSPRGSAVIFTSPGYAAVELLLRLPAD